MTASTSQRGCSISVRFERHYLLSLEGRFGGHLSAINSDFDIGKCDDRVTDGLKDAKYG